MNPLDTHTTPPPDRSLHQGRRPLARAGLLIPLFAVVLGACTTTASSTSTPNNDRSTTTTINEGPRNATRPSATPPGSPSALDGVRPPTTTTTAPSPTSTTTTPNPASTTSTSTTSTTTTTVPDPLAEVANRQCVQVISAGQSLPMIADEQLVSTRSLWIENDYPTEVVDGDLVDVCVDNGTDDIRGAPRPRHDDPTVTEFIATSVEDLQRKLNELFAPYGIQPLAVDGISGPLTGQRLCAARQALGLEPTVDDLQWGSTEQTTILTATDLSAPMTTAVETERWALIDRTCQVMFIGAQDQLVFVFPTSTGTEGFETRPQDRARVFRYNPAVDNGGWHDSSEYPVGVDNPLNGNLYKPLYFDLGQAIHGATNVPPVPASKGCARLSVAHQEALLSWLGLLDATEETWLKNEINLTVNVQGDFIGR